MGNSDAPEISVSLRCEVSKDGTFSPAPFSRRRIVAPVLVGLRVGPQDLEMAR